MAKLKIVKKAFKKTDIKKFGHLVFAAGIILTLFFTLKDPTKLSVNSAIILLVLGLIVGLLDVAKKEANSFLIAVIALIIISGIQFQQITWNNIGLYLKGFFLNATLFLGLAGAIVSLKIIYRVYKETK